MRYTRARSRSLVVLTVMALLAMLALPHTGGAQAAMSSAARPLTNPLIQTNAKTGSRAVMMPTRTWLAQRASSFSTSSTSPASTTSALPAPMCTLATDSSAGDAHAVVNSQVTQFDSLDLTAFGLSSDTSNITGQISVQSLSDGTPTGPAVPAVAGGGDVWYIVWNYGTTAGIKGYFLEAEYPGNPGDAGYTNNASTSNLPVDFKYGTIVTSATGGEQYSTGGGATGTFDVTNSRLSITAPLTSVGSPNAGDILASPNAQTDALVGTSASGGLLESTDKLPSASKDYQVGNSGTSCPGPKGPTTGPTLPANGNPANLSYYGGPVIHAIHNYIIWWLPKTGTTTYSDGSSCTIPGTVSYSYEQPTSGVKPVGALPGGPDGDADYQAIIQQYFNDLSGTSFYNLLTQYSDLESGQIVNNEALGSTWTDNCGYTSTPSVTTPPVPGGTQAAPIYQSDIQAEVQRAISKNHWPDGVGNEYFVYTGYGAADCFAPPGPGGLTPTCSVAGPVPGYCAYHGDFQDPTGNYVLYADMADGAFAANPSTVNLCYSSPIGVTDPHHTVNGNAITDPIADAEVSITSHEQYETATDAEVGTAQQLAPPLAWYDAVNGEIGDKCAYIYGNYASDGSNVNLHGDHYIVQEEYSNWDNGCALTAYQSNGGYGGTRDSVSIQQGTTLIGIPVSGITDTAQLVSNIEANGLPAGSITQVQIYRNGQLLTYTPGTSTTPLSLTRTTGVLVTSNVAGTWKPTGTRYTTSPVIKLATGWNLVAATYPNPGLMTDVIWNQIAAETGACTAAILTNAACSPTITEIKSIGAGGATIDWTPKAADSNGNAVWPQTQGNQIPFTSGMWIYAVKPITWTVQGSRCQWVDSTGVCH